MESRYNIMVIFKWKQYETGQKNYNKEKIKYPMII